MLAAVAAGCSQDRTEALPRVRVTGTVFLDDAPLSHARIWFLPVDGGSAARGVGVVRDGVFDIPAEHGPSPGRCHVVIEPEALEDVELAALVRSGKPAAPDRVEIPIRYQTPGTLLETIADADSAVDSNNFHFDLKR
jgi:hypothetical protein